MIRICEMDIGNLKARNFTKLVQVQNFLFTFLNLKVFRHEESEAQSFYADFSICPPACAAPEANY